MVVGSIPAGGTIDVKRRSAERRFLSTLRRAPAAASPLNRRSRTFQVRFAPLSGRSGSPEPMLAGLCSSGHSRIVVSLLSDLRF